MLTENDWVLIEESFSAHMADVFSQAERDKDELGIQANFSTAQSYAIAGDKIDEKAKERSGEMAYLAIEQVLRAKRAVISQEEQLFIKAKLSQMINRVSGGMPYQSAWVFQKYKSKLDVLFMEINSSIASSNPNMTFNGPVGVVVSHGGTASNFNVTINGSTVTEVSSLLDKAIESIKKTAVDSVLSTQTQEVLGEIKTEVGQPKPNSIKLKSLISGLATTIQTVGELKPAYDSIKSVALLLGVTLP